MLYTIRQMFLKGSTIKDAINYIFKMTGKMPTKSEGMKIINMYQDVQKHSGKVIQFPKDRITPFHIPRPGEASPLVKDSPEAIAKIKAENKAAAERLRKKKEAEELFTDERPPKDPDFASGGIARVGFAGGSGLKFIGGKIWKDFIEKLFIKTSNDIRQGKGKWAGLTQDQWIKQHDNLTKMIKKWEWGGKKGLPKGAEQYIGMNDLQVTKAIKDATKKVDKDRVATADDLDDYIEILDPTGEAGVVEEGMTVGQLDDMVVEHKAYVDDMYQQYKRGDLDKYVKPEVLEEQTLRFQKNMDDGIDEAYEEIRGGSGFTGDYKYDADVLTDSMEEVWKKNRGPSAEFTDKQRDVAYNMALKRVQKNLKSEMDAKKALKDVEQKVELQMFDPKDRKPNASGGIAGELHLNDGGRVSFTKGGKVSSGLAKILGV